MSESLPALADLISIAQIMRPQGRYGEVIADLLTDFPERFATIKAAWAVWPSGEIRRIEVERAWQHKGRIVLKISGYDEIARAEMLRGVRLAVTSDELISLPPDTYYDFDLLNCEVVTTRGEKIGHIVKIERYGAAPLLVVRAGEREHLIPLTLSICIEVDIARKLVVVDPPEGLLEL